MDGMFVWSGVQIKMIKAAVEHTNEGQEQEWIRRSRKEAEMG